MIGWSNEGLLTGNKLLNPIGQYLPIILGDIQVTQVDDFPLTGSPGSTEGFHESMGNKCLGVTPILFENSFNEHCNRKYNLKRSVCQVCNISMGDYI